VIAPGLLDFLRTVSETFLGDQAAISRYTETNGPDGVVQSWTTIASGIACRVSPTGASGAEDQAAGGGIQATSDWTVWLPALTDVTERDRITVTGADRADGRVFEVSRVGQRTYEAVRECLCRLVA